MSTHFVGIGNIGAAPEYKVFQSGNNEPRCVLRLSVYFDNPVPGKQKGEFEDKDGFWAPVEMWLGQQDAEHYARLYQKGMRVMVQGRMRHEKWETDEGEPRSAMKIDARGVGILPHRLESIVMAVRERQESDPRITSSQDAQGKIPKHADFGDFADDIPF